MLASFCKIPFFMLSFIGLLLLGNAVLSETQEEECRFVGNEYTCQSKTSGSTPQRGLQTVLEQNGKSDFKFAQYGKDQVSFRVDDEEKHKLMTQGIINYMEGLPAKVKSSCKNMHEACLLWASVGECETNSKYMENMCAPVCQSCKEMSVDDIVQSRNVLKYGIEQQSKPLEALRKMVEYMENVVWTDPAYEGVRPLCMNQHEECLKWASQGECENNPKYMKKDCAPSCQTCDYLDINLKCPYVDDPSRDVWKAGDLNRMFLRIARNKSLTEKLTILSMPHNATGSLTEFNKNEIMDGPWIITISDFATDEECDKFIELAHESGFEQSKQAGKEKHDGSFEVTTTYFRTSSNTWCVNKCYDSEVNQQMLRRIHELTEIPPVNYEQFQLLQYHEGQYYKVHHDLIEHHIRRNQGVRILTVFFYLSDDFDGGGTRFPSLDLTVKPKKGTVLIWPSVYDELPHTADLRTEHEAMAVIGDGVKYAANAWVHQRNFLEVYEDECHL